ncbi:hypothetical protein VOLCADRAFT_91175 [Volvox carteri f. nagariensis]|uniref:Pherophorin domain-containing protein n=1 Tax=Volvox carteri f. nagariensis TaxID=3068 RepID=D8TWD6_VOLCA|nr:uncharacterized protein VOLCADRAFT_91175 [Volvox carteri f. nagariensis]EFJ48137.1 hypothetical protein VOLCADRAFT_91175 [Volvox carteri f. nagariensis]|eukprot:XP_002950822.1 hypothetical protein VOLCADRAFT_91175 [Volvox carteri f. nagariensis]
MSTRLLLLIALASTWSGSKTVYGSSSAAADTRVANGQAAAAARTVADGSSGSGFHHEGLIGSSSSSRRSSGSADFSFEGPRGWRSGQFGDARSLAEARCPLTAVNANIVSSLNLGTTVHPKCKGSYVSSTINGKSTNKFKLEVEKANNMALKGTDFNMNASQIMQMTWCITLRAPCSTLEQLCGNRPSCSTPAETWTTSNRTFALTLPSALSGVESHVLSSGYPKCVGQRISSTWQLGPGGCISTALQVTHSSSNLTTVTVRLYGNVSASSQSNSSNCEELLRNLTSPAWSMIRLADPNVTAEVAQKNSSTPAAFMFNTTLLVPFRIAAGKNMTFNFTISGNKAINDICEQRVLDSQSTDTCVVHVFDNVNCMVGIVSDTETPPGPVVGLGGAPMINRTASPPPQQQPPVDTSNTRVDNTTVVTKATSSNSSKLSNGQIALIVCLIVGAVILAIVFLVLLWRRRNKYDVGHSVEAQGQGETLPYNHLPQSDEAR